jgi:starvation-inducible DNA-binding protein
MKTRTGINQDNLDEIVKYLRQILADEFVLYVKTLNAHWNVEGNDFHDKHIFFEIQHKELSNIIDMVAERIRTLGHYAPASLTEFLKLTHFTEQSRKTNNSIGFIELLLDDHHEIIISLRGNSFLAVKLKDVGTADFVNGLIEKHEQMAWKLRVHLS